MTSSVKIEKFMWHFKGPQIAKTIQRQNKVDDTLPNCATYQKAIVINTIWYTETTEHNRKPRNKPYTYSQMIFDKGAKTIYLIGK